MAHLAPVNPTETPIDPLRALRGKPETRTSPRPESERMEGEYEPRYVDVPRHRRVQLAAERNLKWGLAVLLLALGLIGAALIVSGPRALVPVVLCLVTFTILWVLARLRVFHQRNGVFFAAAVICLLGAAVPLIERGYAELERMAHSGNSSENTVAAASPTVPPEQPPPVLEKVAESATTPEPEPPSLVESLKIKLPDDPTLDLVRVLENTRIMIGRKPYLLLAGDTFVLDAVNDGRVTFLANELRVSVPEKAMELMAAKPPEPAVLNAPRSPVGPPSTNQPRVSDGTAPGDATARAQAEAVRRYPAIGVKGSPENELFLARFRQFKEERPEFFEEVEWPIYLADGVAKEQGWERVR